MRGICSMMDRYIAASPTTLGIDALDDFKDVPGRVWPVAESGS